MSAETKKTRVDIGSIGMLYNQTPYSSDVFRGAVAAAERLGHVVSTREIRDGNGRLHSIVASVEVPA